MGLFKIKVLKAPPVKCHPAWVGEAWVGLELEFDPEVNTTAAHVYDIRNRDVICQHYRKGFAITVLEACYQLKRAGKKEAADYWKRVYANNGRLHRNWIALPNDCCSIVMYNGVEFNDEPAGIREHLSEDIREKQSARTARLVNDQRRDHNEEMQRIRDYEMETAAIVRNMKERREKLHYP